MAQNARRQMSSSKKNGMSKYRSITQNGVRYYLVPQAKGTYALKTADGKMAGSLPLIKASSYAAVMKQAKRIIREIEAEENLTNNVTNSNVVTFNEYVSSSKELAIIEKTPSELSLIEKTSKELDLIETDVLPSEALDFEEQESFNSNYSVRPNMFDRVKSAFRNRPKVVEKSFNRADDLVMSRGLNIMREGINNIRRDSNKDMFLGGVGSVVNFGEKQARKLESFQQRYTRRRDEQTKNTVFSGRRERHREAKEMNETAFKSYKQSLIADKYESITELQNQIEKATTSKNNQLTQTLIMRKNEITKEVNEFMRKKQTDFPDFTAPFPNLPHSMPSKQESFKSRLAYYWQDINIDAVQTVNKKAEKYKALENRRLAKIS